MSELKINEDNCVLDGEDLISIKKAFEVMAMEMKLSDRDIVKHHYHHVFLKITKLNEMAKEKQNERG